MANFYHGQATINLCPISANHAMKQLLILISLFTTLMLAGCDDPVRVQPLPPGATILAFGDSVTHGTGAGQSRNYPDLLAETTGLNVINSGIPGDTAAQAKERISPLLDQHTPDLVIVELGGNDFLAKRSQQQVKQDLSAIVATVKQRNIPVVLVAVPAFSVFRASAGALKDSPIYGELGEETGTAVIADVFADILSNSELRADPIHPNGAGYQRLAEGIHQALIEAGYLP